MLFFAHGSPEFTPVLILTFPDQHETGGIHDAFFRCPYHFSVCPPRPNVEAAACPTAKSAASRSPSTALDLNQPPFPCQRGHEAARLFSRATLVRVTTGQRAW